MNRSDMQVGKVRKRTRRPPVRVRVVGWLLVAELACDRRGDVPRRPGPSHSASRDNAGRERTPEPRLAVGSSAVVGIVGRRLVSIDVSSRDPQTDLSCTALPLPARETMSQVSGIGAHFCGLSETGSVYCWGENSAGPLGDGSREPHRLPGKVVALSEVRQVVAGGAHSCAALKSGEVYCWGRNREGQAGARCADSLHPRLCTRPVRVEGLPSMWSLSAGSFHTCGVSTTGDAYCWGTFALPGGRNCANCLLRVRVDFPVSEVRSGSRFYSLVPRNETDEARCFGS
jgi:serine/threonine-protein kinase